MRKAVVAALALLLAITGCAGFPTSGGVDVGEVISEEIDSGIVFGPDEPLEDASQEEILNGFLQAAVAPGGNYEIARLFLAEGVDWNPNALLSIRDDAGTVTRDDDTTLTYSFLASAFVDSDGVYSEEAQSAQRFEVGFTQNDDGQWRISEVPDGVVLAAVRFDSVFDDFPLWYFDPSFSYLVPDIRWFAAGRANVASVVVSELLQGPAPYLGEGAVVPAFPAGTERVDGSVVEIEDGIAAVDLSSDAARSSDVDRDRMRQQLTETLRSGFNVTGATITVDDVPLPLPDVPGADAITVPTVDPAPLVLRDGEFGFATGDATTRVPGVSAQVEELGPLAVTYAVDSSVAAVLAESGVVLVRGSTDQLLLDDRDGLAQPSLDPLGFVWSARGASASSIRAFDFAGAPHEIRSNLPSDARIVAMKVSRDGARMLLALDTSTGPRLLVKGIVREGTVPVALTSDTLQFPIAGATPIDATWVDERSVALLADAAGGRGVTLFDLGGPREALGIATGGEVITGGNGGVGGLRVLADGVLLQRRGTSWLPTRIEATLLATQK